MIATIVQYPGGKREATVEGPGPSPLREVLEAAGIGARDGEKADYAVNGEPTKDLGTPVPDGAVVTKTTVRVEGGC
jgi:hypothetical protein